MEHRKKILVVDDNVTNRMILHSILEKDYLVYEAVNGLSALEKLMNNGGGFSLIMLDLAMPVMDGYQLMSEMKIRGLDTIVPVIVTTASNDEQEEIRSLESGATDFVGKPYNPEIVRHRINSILRLKEQSSMLNILKFDSLTGTLSKDYFYQRVQRIIDENPDKRYDIICSDVDNFKIINEKYGEEISNKLLCFLADSHLDYVGSRGVCGRIASDIFALFIERSDNYLSDDFIKRMNIKYSMSPVSNVTVKFGLYHINDTTIPVSTMCDRALLSLRYIQYKYGICYATYDDTVRIKLLHDQQVCDCAEDALSDHQFSVYFQPKHATSDCSVAGAEALVRWTHPEFGFMSPGEFIPLFERNGFISKLDYYVWEEVCRFLSNRLKEGLAVVPVSVNVSHADFNSEMLEMKILQLADSYGVPHELLHLEVTESAYTGNPQQIISIVDELRNMGFVVEMDDFGSGYSSLNMLSELPIDILKLDMRFMKGKASKNGILSFVVSLSKWLNYPTVAEGVETQDEFELLKSLGCDYIQGYYFAKPMPESDFTEYLNSHALQNDLKHESEQVKTKAKRDKNKQTLLIVDDLEMNRIILSRMLEPYYNIMTAENGETAYEIMSNPKNGISVVLLDLLMPIMDGYRFMEMHNDSSALSEIPVIITSEYTEDGESRALEFGAYGFVSKPYRRDVILSRINSALEHVELLRQHLAKNA